MGYKKCYKVFELGKGKEIEITLFKALGCAPGVKGRVAGSRGEGSPSFLSDTVGESEMLREATCLSRPVRVLFVRFCLAESHSELEVELCLFLFLNTALPPP